MYNFEHCAEVKVESAFTEFGRVRELQQLRVGSVFRHILSANFWTPSRQLVSSIGAPNWTGILQLGCNTPTGVILGTGITRSGSLVRHVGIIVSIYITLKSFFALLQMVLT